MATAVFGDGVVGKVVDNYALFVCPAVIAYGSNNAHAIDIWPNGMSALFPTDVVGVRLSSVLRTSFFPAFGVPFVQLFNDGHMWLPIAGTTSAPPNISFFSQPTLRNDQGIDLVASSGKGYLGLWSKPIFDTISTGLITVDIAYAVIFQPTVNAGSTVNFSAGLKVADGGGTGTIGTQFGIDIDALTKGATNVSIRSSGTSVTMRHAGPVRVGSGTTDPIGGSILHVDGGLTAKRRDVANISDNVLTTDCIVTVSGLTTSRTLTLPASSTAAVGKVYIFKDGDGSVTGVNTLVISRAGGDTIDGAATRTLSTAGGSAIYSNRGDGRWWIVSERGTWA